MVFLSLGPIWIGDRLPKDFQRKIQIKELFIKGFDEAQQDCVVVAHVQKKFETPLEVFLTRRCQFPVLKI